MKLSELAEKSGYEFIGEDVEIMNIRYSICAEKNSIAIVNNEKEMEQTKAICLLVRPTLVYTDKSLLFASDSLEVASVKVASILYENDMGKEHSRVSYKKVNDYFVGDNVSVGEQTYISPNVCIGNNVTIGKNCLIEPNVTIGNNTVIGNNVYIAAGSFVGANSFYHYFDEEIKEFHGVGKTVISSGVTIGSNTTIQRGTFSDTYIGRYSKIGNLVDVGHDVQIGENCKIVSQTGIAGNVRIGNFVQINGQVGIVNNVQIGDYVIVKGKSVVTKNISSYKTVSGNYAREHCEELRTQIKLRKL